jgi:type I restriction enzyme R subunit
MRHLIDTYIEAAEPRTISPFDDLPLLEVITKTGMLDAIGTLPAGVQGNRTAVAEIIENNVRSTIIKEQLNDPAYYSRMSALLDEIIAARKAKAIEYEEYLKKIAELVRQVQAGQADDTPMELRAAGVRALYNNLRREHGEGGAARSPEERLQLALTIDAEVKRVRPDSWRGVQTREQVIKRAIYDVLQDVDEVERIFLIIKQQQEY